MNSKLLSRGIVLLATMALTLPMQQVIGAGKFSRQPSRVNTTKRPPFGYYPVKWRRWEDVQAARSRSLKKEIGTLPSSQIPKMDAEAQATSPRTKPSTSSSRRPRSQQPPMGNLLAPPIDALPPVDASPFSTDGGVGNPFALPPALSDDLKDQLNLGPADNNNLQLPAVEEKPPQQPAEPAKDSLEDLFPKAETESDIFTLKKNPLRRSPRENFEPIGSSAISSESIRAANDAALRNSIAKIDELPLASIPRSTTANDFLSSTPRSLIGNPPDQDLVLEQASKFAPIVAAQANLQVIRRTSAVAPVEKSETKTRINDRRSNPLRSPASISSRENRLPSQKVRLWKARRNPLRSE